jgi:hypothetical protein
MKWWNDPVWIFGFSLLLAWVVIILVIGIGTVTQEKSFGLDKAIGALNYLSGGWSVKAFERAVALSKQD